MDWKHQNFQHLTYVVRDTFIRNDANEESLKQYFRTARFDDAMLKACKHPLAEIPDIIEVIENYIADPQITLHANKEWLDKCKTNLEEALYVNKRSALNNYVKDTHGIDIQHISPKLISQILGIEF
jgi:hypothetical protein